MDHIQLVIDGQLAFRQEEGSSDEPARAEVVSRLQSKLNFFIAQQEKSKAEMERLKELDEHAPEFNPEYYYRFASVDGPNARHDDPTTPANEGFTMGNTVVKARLIQEAEAEYSTWLLLSLDLDRIIALVKSI